MKKTFFAGLFLALGTLVVNAQQVEPSKDKVRKTGRKHSKKAEVKKEEVKQIEVEQTHTPPVETVQPVEPTPSTTELPVTPQPADKK